MELAIKLVLASFGAFFAALWVTLVLWTYRDIRSRSSSIVTHIMATLMVAVFNVLGVALYLLIRPRETLADAYDRALEEETLLREVEEQRACPNCRRPVEEDFIACPACKTQLKRECPCRRRLLALRWDLCPYCGDSVPVEKPASFTVRGAAG